MSEYLNGDALLADAVQRLGPLGHQLGVLVVEGFTDKAVFSRWCSSVAQIVVAGGKQLAVNAHRKMTDEDRRRIVVVIDCDGSAGVLSGSPNMIVTTHNDLEADLVLVDNLGRVVSQLLAGDLDSNEQLARISEQVIERATGAAVALGTVRRAASNAGVRLRFHPGQIEFSRLRAARQVDVPTPDALREVLRVHEASAKTALSEDEVRRIEQRVAGHPLVGLSECNGKDIVAAAGAVLVMDFRVPKRVLGGFDELVRASVTDALREELGVVRRLRRWERANGTRLLAA